MKHRCRDPWRTRDVQRRMIIPPFTGVIVEKSAHLFFCLAQCEVNSCCSTFILFEEGDPPGWLFKFLSY